MSPCRDDHQYARISISSTTVMAHSNEGVDDDRGGHHSTTAPSRYLSSGAHDLGALAALGQCNDGRHLWGEQLLHLVCLHLDKDYTATK